jgi:uncharacterized protein YndB with AHSA1/START domain
VVLVFVSFSGLSVSAARGEVTGLSEHGFEITLTQTTVGTQASVFDAFFDVQQWWNADHTYSGNRSNLSMERKAGGLFLETLPGGGQVEHMRVTALMPPRMLVMRGALGPLGFEGVAAVLVMQLRPVPADPNQSADTALPRTEIRWTYRVGGFRKDGFDALAPAVDGVLATQLDGLANLLGRRKSSQAQSSESESQP